MNLIRSTLGLFLGSLLACSLVKAADDGIYNFHQISAQLLTAGQITQQDLPVLKTANIGLVINLAVADEERNGDEGYWITSEGMSYMQIPVSWQSPTLAELEMFFDLMDARGDRNVMVHCFANFRASAFTYLYRVIRQGVAEADARAGLEAIWSEESFEESPQWAAFIDLALAEAK